MKNKRKLFWARAICTLLAMMAMAFIFSNSAQTAARSSSRSGTVTQTINGYLEKRGAKVRVTEHLVRKQAHFAEYALLGSCLLLAVRVWLIRRRQWQRAGLALLLGAVTAAADETLQLFFSGRSGQVSDVLLDSAGCLAGILCMAAVLHLLQKWQLLFWQE